MAEQTFTDDIDSVSFFDDLIQFPPVTDTSLNSVDYNDFANNWTNNSDELQVSDSIFSGSNCASTLSAVLAVPYEDIVQLEWLSTFVEDSFSGGGLTMNKDNIPVKKEPEPEPEPESEPLVVPNYHSQMSSPVSVLESSSSSSSSSSCSGGDNVSKMIPITSTPRGPQRARSKRPRPPAFNPCAAIGLFTTSTFIPAPVSTEFENLLNGPKSGGGGPDQKKRKKPKKSEAQINPEDKTENQNQNQMTGHGVRKCMHCEITKTPQWRAGPMGPKSLCNACGVRYKSGRLFPEYRPAASPTFVPSLHSNSHKKVVEMRTKCVPTDAMATLPGPEPELIPNMNPPAAGCM